MTDDPNHISLPGGYSIGRKRDMSCFRLLLSPSFTVGNINFDMAASFAAAMNAETARADAAEARVKELETALRPFAAVCEKVEQFIADRVADGGSPIMGPTKDWRLSDFRRARAALAGREQK